MSQSVRLSAKAIIIQSRMLFTMHHRDPWGDYYILPGGGVNNGEDLISALQRECAEEACARLSVGDVVFVRDYIEDNHEFAGNKPGFHQVEIMFACELLNPDEIVVGEEPDERQVGFAWLPVDRLEEYRLYPKVLIEKIRGFYANKKSAVYLGDVN